MPIPEMQLSRSDYLNFEVQSPCRKGVLEERSGHTPDLRFHIPDRVWRYLLEHKGEFFLEEDLKTRSYLALFQNSSAASWTGDLNCRGNISECDRSKSAHWQLSMKSILKNA